MNCKDCGDPTENTCTCCGQATCLNCVTDPNHGECDPCYQHNWDAVVDAQVHRTVVAYEVGKVNIKRWKTDRALHLAQVEAKRLREQLDKADQQIAGLLAVIRAQAAGVFCLPEGHA